MDPVLHGERIGRRGENGISMTAATIAGALHDYGRVDKKRTNGGLRKPCSEAANGT